MSLYIFLFCLHTRNLRFYLTKSSNGFTRNVCGTDSTINFSSALSYSGFFLFQVCAHFILCVCHEYLLILEYSISIDYSFGCSICRCSFFRFCFVAIRIASGCGSFLISKSYWSQDQGLDANKPEYKIDLDVCVCFVVVSVIVSQFLSAGIFVSSQIAFSFPYSHCLDLKFVSQFQRALYLSLSLFFCLCVCMCMPFSTTLLNLGSFNYI